MVTSLPLSPSLPPSALPRLGNSDVFFYFIGRNLLFVSTTATVTVERLSQGVCVCVCVYVCVSLSSLKWGVITSHYVLWADVFSLDTRKGPERCRVSAQVCLVYLLRRRRLVMCVCVCVCVCVDFKHLARCYTSVRLFVCEMRSKMKGFKARVPERGRLKVD